MQFEHFFYGVCYYPEAWSPAQREMDIDRIADAGFNLVRLGEGAWSYWEPSEGEFQFELFDRTIERCGQRGIRVILGTPTYACPAWVASDYPEVLRWNFERLPMTHGSRRNLNYTSPKMLELSDRICTALADHYRDDPQVIAWQLDNEFNCHMDN
ncbi:MAG: beta-galactosidase [Phycisphaerae bacterium]|nr:beta-galactosidase [Phycisphaerae bacterium]